MSKALGHNTTAFFAAGKLRVAKAAPVREFADFRNEEGS
jgi:hypothetical protein